MQLLSPINSPLGNSPIHLPVAPSSSLSLFSTYSKLQSNCLIIQNIQPFRIKRQQNHKNVVFISPCQVINRHLFRLQDIASSHKEAQENPFSIDLILNTQTMDQEDPLSRIELQSTLMIHGRCIFIVHFTNSARTASPVIKFDHIICIALHIKDDID